MSGVKWHAWVLVGTEAAHVEESAEHRGPEDTGLPSSEYLRGRF